MGSLRIEILASIGVVLIVAMLYCFFRRSVKMDRMLAKGEFKTLFYILLFVFLVPLTLSAVLHCLSLTGRDFIGNDNNADVNIVWTMLYHSLDPGNLNTVGKSGHRIIAFLVALFGVVMMNGVLVSSIVSLYERYVNKWEKGLARYHRELKSSNFIVIIGNNELIPDLIRQIFARKEKIDYVVVQTNSDIEAFRKFLSSFLSHEDEQRVIVYYGEQNSADDIADLHLECAKEVFILGDSVEDEAYKTNHDALNMSCLQIISDQLSKRPPRPKELICRVMFEYQTSFSIFQFADISDKIKKYIEFRPFNYYEQWAQRVFVNRDLTPADIDVKDYLPLEGKEPITVDSDDFVHLVVVGMSKTGISMAIEAAHLAHYPNFNRDTKLKTRITFIDTECAKEMDYFQARFKEMFALARWRLLRSECKSGTELYDSTKWENDYPCSQNSYLGGDFIDVEWEFIEGGVECTTVQQYLRRAAQNSHARFTLAICLPQDNQSVAASLYLPDEVYEKAVQVLVYQRHGSAIIDSISHDGNKNKYYTRLKAFGMLQCAYDDSLNGLSYKIAQTLDAHYYEMYQQVNRVNNVVKSDRTNLRGKSEAAKLWSNIYNANTIWGKLRSINYAETKTISEQNVELLARTEHNRWVMEQLLMRFRALTEQEQADVCSGRVDKDVLKGDKMAHLDICSNDRLVEIDPLSKLYDVGFIRIIPEILENIDADERQADC